MKTIHVLHCDAFSKIPNKGNPAGVVLDGDHLTDAEMQDIARKVGFNETAFSLASEVADIRIRFFTPGHEMNLCGHATMATVHTLKTKGLLGAKSELTIETGAGILPMKVEETAAGDFLITMRQAAPEFVEFKGSVRDLAASIGLEASDIEERLPIVYGSTGAWTLLVPINSLEAFQRMESHNRVFPQVLREMPRASVHPFCLETYAPEADMHARHFSSPFSGTIEDAVTGTASGVMGAYFVKYIQGQESGQTLHLIVEQGQEIGKDGRVDVHVAKNGESYDVEITGCAVYVQGLHVDI